jgi:hypothetical protein
MTPIQEITATLYFDTHRAYVALVERNDNTLQLAYINATREPVDVFHTEEEARSSAGMHELQSILGDIAGKATSMSVSLDMDSVLSYHIPYAAAASLGEMRDFVRLELQLHAPDTDPTLFHAVLHPLQSSPAARVQSALGVFIHPTAIDIAYYAARLANLPLKRLGSAQMDAHNAHSFSYPEHSDELVALCGIQSSCVDVSVVRGRKFLAAETVSLEGSSIGINGKMSVGAACKQTLDNAQAQLGQSIQAALLFGTDLTKAALDETAQMLPCSVERLNPLRRLSTSLSQREREYCARIAHVLAPSVGSALPDASVSIRL